MRLSLISRTAYFIGLRSLVPSVGKLMSSPDEHGQYTDRIFSFFTLATSMTALVSQCRHQRM